MFARILKNWKTSLAAVAYVVSKILILHSPDAWALAQTLEAGAITLGLISAADQKNVTP